MDTNQRKSSKNARKYKKKFLWTTRNEKILLKLWKERVPDLKNSPRTRPVYEEIRQKLQEKGCFVEINEITHKIHNLKTKYKKERISRDAGCSPSEWPLYDVLDDILSSFEMENGVKLVAKFSRCDKSSSHQSNSEEYVSDKYANEDFFDNEDENEEDDDDDEAASTSMPERKNANSNNDTTYLQAMNTNLELMVEKLNELSENIQSWEEKGNAQLVQISNILRKQKTRASEYNNSLMPAKIIQFPQSDNAMEDISNFDEEIPKDQMGEEDETKIPTMKSYSSQRNKTIIDDYLKTKQLEREFMIEKHNLQMELLKLEIEAKRNEVLRDA